MKFKTPCFVRVEDAEDRKRLLTWLQDIGYSLYQSARELSYPIVCCNMIDDDEPGNVYGEYEEELVDASHACDCGTNIELFKALAAMNDENDQDQWFVHETATLHEIRTQYEPLRFCGHRRIWMNARSGYEFGRANWGGGSTIGSIARPRPRKL